MRSWWVLPVVTAAVLGVLLGGVLYVVRPLQLTASGVRPAESAGPPVARKTPAESAGSTVASKTPAESPGSTVAQTPTPSVPNGPVFTQRALLQSNEFMHYKWGKADRLSLTTGISAQPILRCVRPDRITIKPVAAYAATHHGLSTLAGEQVIRYHSVAEAENVFDQLAEDVGQCAEADPARQASVGQQHDPELVGISRTRWWNVRGLAKDDPMRGVLVIMRVDDRLMALCLTSNSTDPAVSTDIIPLMRQGGLRMV